MTAETTATKGGEFDLEPTREALVLKLKGSWRLSGGISSMDGLFARQELTSIPKRIKVDSSALKDWDSALICFLVELKKRCQTLSIAFDGSDLPEGARRLVDLALAVPEREDSKRVESRSDFLTVIGRDAIDAFKSGGEMIDFLGESFIALGRAIRGRARFRMSDALHLVQQCGPDALPIVTLISFLVGMILAFVGLVQLEQFGADIFVANLVAVAMVREMGGMMTAIIMSGRTGAAFAAQLGTMQVNDEIAAFRTIGIPPIEFIVLPRMLALIFAVPLLTIYANVIGMLGGSLVTVALTDVSLLQYYVQTVQSIGLIDWASGLFKATVYGIIIAISGCLRGMQSKKSAAAVGEAATSAVVMSIVLIIVAEAVLTIMYQILGI
ncbi:MAG: ABC transporter permease [Kiloniellales bacterium]|nr:ABC transporter permease [Kiloniellales bacterium]MDJ0969931.1 ABC transporter permease [Kiloniellales bacterium]